MKLRIAEFGLRNEKAGAVLESRPLESAIRNPQSTIAV